MAAITTERLTDFERRLRALELELHDLQRQAVPQPEPVRLEPPPLPPRRPVVEREALAARVAALDLLGARTLAWAGGVVTLLGVVLLFALAAHRGWIGPGTRVALGAIVSSLLFAAGLRLRGRSGHSALAAVGAGLAGAYATLLAATALYGLVPAWGALLAATAIAATGVATALAWRSQLVAGLGLVGALLVPLAYLADGSLTATGTGFAAFVLAGAAAVAIDRRWRRLLLVSVAASLPQIGVLVAARHAGAVPLAVVFWLLYLGAGLALQLRLRRSDLSALPGGLVVLSAGFCALASLRLFGGTQGFVLLGAAAVYLAPALALRRVRRNLASLLGLVAGTYVAIAAADLLSGTALVLVWAAQSAHLAWLVHRVRDRRLQAAALGYLALGLVHALAFDAPLTRLFVAHADPADGAPALLGLAAAALVAARDGGRRLRRACVAAAGLLVLYAGALGLLAAGGFAWGQVGVTATWALAGLAALCAGIVRRDRDLQIGARAWLGIVVLKTLAFDAWHVSTAALLVAAAPLLAASYVNERVRRDRLELDSALGFVASIGLGVAGIAGLATGAIEGAALLGMAAILAVVAAALFRTRRDASTLVWGGGLAVAAVAATLLLSGTALVAAWSAVAVAIAWLAARVRDRRLALGAGALLVLPLGHALALDAPPSALFAASHHPAAGAAAVLLAAAALVAIRRLGAVDGRSDWLAGALALYAVSLGLLEATLRAGGSFATGHVLVSATWALAALALLTRRPLRRAATLLFVASLGKLFLYDLASLSALTRTASFLAVGAALLAGGHRLYRSQLREREAGGAQL